MDIKDISNLNKDSRRIIIGDIHGYYNTLQSLLNKLKLQTNDIIIFLEDYINRGPSSYKVVKLVQSLSYKYNNLIAINIFIYYSKNIFYFKI